MKLPAPHRFTPAPLNAGLAILSAVLLVLAFPGFEFWFCAWFALVPLFFAVEREKESAVKSLVVGWIFGTAFFFGSCWWLTFAPIAYAGFPVLLAYFLLLLACLAVGFFSGIFAAAFSVLLKRFGSYAILSAPFLWTAIEFLRFWTTGNNWNAIGYSQAFAGAVKYANFGGIYYVSFIVIFLQSLFFFFAVSRLKFLENSKHPSAIILLLFSVFGWIVFMNKTVHKKIKAIDAEGGVGQRSALLYCLMVCFGGIPFGIISHSNENNSTKPIEKISRSAFVIAVQPNVPMSGLKYDDLNKLRERHIQLAENALDTNLNKFAESEPLIESSSEKFERGKEPYAEYYKKQFRKAEKIVIFPESPMNFTYTEDTEFQEFVRAFAVKNDVSVLFNAAEPDARNKTYFNSAVMVDRSGAKIAQYDKIYLVPFGESVPAPLKNIMPALVGSFSYGEEYDLLPFGEAKAGVMICFESHFGNLSREFVRRGADVIVEMTNDGYLGKTPILRQHLANAVFRAVETNRPVLRVTNVGVTAYINERGEISDAADSYAEATRVWTIAKSDGSQTFYVKYGDWFAWLCSLVSLALLFLSFRKRNRHEISPKPQK